MGRPGPLMLAGEDLAIRMTLMIVMLSTCGTPASGAAVNHTEAEQTDMATSGAEPALSGSGQITSFVHTQESGEVSDVTLGYPSGSSGDVGSPVNPLPVSVGPGAGTPHGEVREYWSQDPAGLRTSLATLLMTGSGDPLDKLEDGSTESGLLPPVASKPTGDSDGKSMTTRKTRPMVHSSGATIDKRAASTVFTTSLSAAETYVTEHAPAKTASYDGRVSTGNTEEQRVFTGSGREEEEVSVSVSGTTEQHDDRSQFPDYLTSTLHRHRLTSTAEHAAYYPSSPVGMTDLKTAAPTLTAEGSSPVDGTEDTVSSASSAASEHTDSAVSVTDPERSDSREHESTQLHYSPELTGQSFVTNLLTTQQESKSTRETMASEHRPEHLSTTSQANEAMTRELRTTLPDAATFTKKTLAITTSLETRPDTSDSSTFSGAEYLTTADNIFTSQIETSHNTRNDMESKSTSDDFYVSGISRTRRHTRSTNGQTFQQTTADFISTVPTSTDPPSLSQSTVSPTSDLRTGLTSEQSFTPYTITATTTDTTTTTATTASTTTPTPPSTTATVLGSFCTGNDSCERLTNSYCREGVCSCRQSYFNDGSDMACIREPYDLSAEEENASCFRLSWKGDGNDYNVTAVSSVAGDDSWSRVRSSTTVQLCQFSPGAAVNVSVRLSNGGQAATASYVLRPSKVEDLNISFVNETCFKAVWQAGPGRTDMYRVHSTYITHVLQVRTEEANYTTSKTQWTNCGLAPGTQFNVIVYSQSYGVESGSQALVASSTVPSQPTYGEIVDASERSLRMTWAAGRGQHESFSISYEVGGARTEVTIRNSNTKAISGLRPGSRYQISIRAVSGQQHSSPLLLDGCTAPEQVTDLSATTIEATWVRLTWKAPKTGNVDAYLIKSGSAEHFTRKRPEITIDGLTPGTDYTFGVASQFCNITSTEEMYRFMTNFSELTSVNVTAVGTDLYVSWSVDQATGTAISVQVLDAVENIVFYETVTTSPLVVQTNRSGECFTVRLGVANSPRVQTIIRATEPAAPGKVQNLQARRPISDRGTIRVTWSPPSVQNGVIMRYVVTAVGQRGLRNVSTEVQGRHSSMSCHAAMALRKHDRQARDAPRRQPHWADVPYETLLANLSEYENYDVTVVAYTEAGGGPPSFVAVGDQLLDKVNDLSVTAFNSTCLNVSWSRPDNADRNSSVQYLVEYQAVEDVDDLVNETALVNSTALHQLLCGLQYWTVYEVNVSALDQQGPGREDTRIHRTEEHVPEAVRNLTLVPPNKDSSARHLLISWKPPERVHGRLRYYYVILTDLRTGDILEYRIAPEHSSYVFHVSSDHMYKVQLFGETRAGNGTRAEERVIIPSGVLPRGKKMVSVEQKSAGTSSVQVHIPASLLCDFTYGRPRRAGYIVHRSAWTHQVLQSGQSMGSTPVVTTRGRDSDMASPTTAFFVPLRVQQRCTETLGSGGTGLADKELSVLVGDPHGKNCERPQLADNCGVPLRSGTEFHVLVVFCTSEACTYARNSPVFTTQVEHVPDDNGGDSSGLAAGLVVLVVVVLLGSGGAYFLYRRHSTRQAPPPVPQPQEPVTMEEISRHRPVALEMFIEHVQQLHKDSNLGFSDEYKTIKDLTPVFPTKAAELAPCKAKNRYQNIRPWDRSRVKLLPSDDEEGSDYINASYLPGENHQREFIASQGPLLVTIDDFWRMIWENRVCIVVMLTQCVERGKPKCEKYWPDEGVQTIYGDLVVQVRSESVLPDYMIRVIDIKLGNQSRMIKHFHFLRWPDHGCPEKTSMLLNFVSSVRAHMPHSGAGPTLVHCSAGVGRTGTFIALDQLLQQIRYKREVDIFSLVLTMREHRMMMVQTENQYIYIHDCLADALTKDQESDEDESSEDEDEHIYGNC